MSSIDLTVQGGQTVRVTGTVRVADGDGDAVRSATVSISWSVNGVFVGSDSDTTSGSGRARLTYRSDELEDGDVVRLAVTGVSASGYDYNPDSNAESADEITVS